MVTEIKELLETMNEAINYMVKLSDSQEWQVEYEDIVVEVLNMSQDVLAAMAVIDDNLSSIETEHTKEYREAMSMMSDTFNKLLDYYDKGDRNNIALYIKNEMCNNFSEYKSKVNLMLMF